MTFSLFLQNVCTSLKMSHQFVFKEKNPFNVVKIKLLNTTSYNFQISKCTFNSHKTYLVLKNLPPSHKWILEGVCLLEHPNSVCTDYHSWPRNKLSELETLWIVFPLPYLQWCNWWKTNQWVTSTSAFVVHQYFNRSIEILTRYEQFRSRKIVLWFLKWKESINSKISKNSQKSIKDCLGENSF